MSHRSPDKPLTACMQHIVATLAKANEHTIWVCCGKSHVTHLTLCRRQAEVKPPTAEWQEAKSKHVGQTATYLHRKPRYN